MGERQTDLIETITRGYEEQRLLIDGLSEEDLDRKTELGWTVRQVAGHIAQAPSGDIFVAKRLSQGKNASLPGALSFVLDLANWFGVRRFKSASKPDILQELEKQHKDLVAYVEGLSDEESDRAGTVMGLGRLTAYDYLKQSPSHGREHGESIRKAVAPGGAPRAG